MRSLAYGILLVGVIGCYVDQGSEETKVASASDNANLNNNQKSDASVSDKKFNEVDNEDLPKNIYQEILGKYSDNADELLEHLEGKHLEIYSMVTETLKDRRDGIKQEIFNIDGVTYNDATETYNLRYPQNEAGLAKLKKFRNLVAEENQITRDLNVLTRAESDRRDAEFNRRIERMRAERDRRDAERERRRVENEQRRQAERERRQAERERRKAETDRRIAEIRAESERRIAEIKRRGEQRRSERRKADPKKSNKVVDAIRGFADGLENLLDSVKTLEKNTKIRPQPNINVFEILGNLQELKGKYSDALNSKITETATSLNIQGLKSLNLGQGVSDRSTLIVRADASDGSVAAFVGQTDDEPAAALEIPLRGSQNVEFTIDAETKEIVARDSDSGQTLGKSPLKPGNNLTQGFFGIRARNVTVKHLEVTPKLCLLDTRC